MKDELKMLSRVLNSAFINLNSSFRLFPSPCGEVEIELGAAIMMVSAGPLFPSPCGEVEIELAEGKAINEVAQRFRPLAGKWKLNTADVCITNSKLTPVSVPLRGSGN